MRLMRVRLMNLTVVQVTLMEFSLPFQLNLTGGRKMRLLINLLLLPANSGGDWFRLWQPLTVMGRVTLLVRVGERRNGMISVRWRSEARRLTEHG